MNKKLQKEINASKYMLDLGENFDDEGSNGPTREMWEKAIHFISTISRIIDSNGHKLIPPWIWHGPNGGVDFQWDTEIDGCRVRALMYLGPDEEFVEFYSSEPIECEGRIPLNPSKFSDIPSFMYKNLRNETD